MIYFCSGLEEEPHYNHLCFSHLKQLYKYKGGEQFKLAKIIIMFQNIS